MPEIDAATLNFTKHRLSKMKDPITIFFFRSNGGRSREIRKILDLLAGLAGGKIRIVEEEPGSSRAAEMSIDMYPAIVIHGARPYNMRFFGTPTGYEYGTLLEDVVDASTGSPRLNPLVRKALEKIDERVHIMVFVTPACPYCPLAVRAAHKYAIVNENIVGDGIEALEFRELADKWSVRNVPKIVINEAVEFDVVPDTVFVKEIYRALGRKPPEELR